MNNRQKYHVKGWGDTQVGVKSRKRKTSLRWSEARSPWGILRPQGKVFISWLEEQSTQGRGQSAGQEKQRF